MFIENIMFISLALSLDAYALALGIGCGKEVCLKEKGLLVISFGFFQGILAFLGGMFGNLVSSYFFEISGYLSGGIIIITGLLFLKEGFENREECINLNLTIFSFITLGVSVSIDALGIGFSLFNKFSFMKSGLNSSVIALVTLIMTALSFFTVKKIKHIGVVEKYSDYIGGIILVILGFEMMI